MQRATSTAAQRIGDAAEALVASRLEAAGWTILARNVRLGRDELDLVAIDPGPPRALVVVEVRRRGRRDFGLAEETRRPPQARDAPAGRRPRCSSAGTLPDGRPLPALPLRIDLVALDVDAGRAAVGPPPPGGDLTRRRGGRPEGRDARACYTPGRRGVGPRLHHARPAQRRPEHTR